MVKRHSFNPENVSTKNMYKLMTGSVVPRPIAWISSQSKEGVLNLAPFSFFTVASRQPPTFAVSIGPGVEQREGTIKDTLTNIRDMQEYVINVVPESLANAMHESSKHFPEDINELERSGLTEEPSATISIPSLKESPIAFECMLDRVIPLGSDHLILGQVMCARIDNSVYLGDYKIDIEQWQPLARLAGNFATLTPPFKLPKE
ncbi:flavin reductase family protein [Salicibibacter halophilus]|uniref:Flavin reductase family protein n=1 Tax=Salicibibacter halophilus TaxID=2502791 RepID=A0A514LJB8_9BACI|nr:flavin reductase family protein [Salicibibacter halophilus]QDI91922.1 flavin reductase family protein [Salicibibacter halophilus]